MDRCLPKYSHAESWTDQELETNFKHPEDVPKSQLLGLLASRSATTLTFQELLREEAICSENQAERVAGFIKVSWLPVLAVLFYGSDSVRNQLKEWIAHWTVTDRRNFLDYIAKEKSFIVWFERKNSE